jgi:hypothetical protein
MQQGNRNTNSTELSALNHIVRILDDFQGNNISNLQALIALLSSHKDFEIFKIKDANGDMYLMRITYNEATGTITTDYVDENGNIATPTFPVSFIDLESILNLIYQNTLPIQGLDTPDILEINGVQVVNLPSGCKGYVVFVFDGTVTHSNGTNTRTLRHNIEYKFAANLDRGFVPLVIEGTDADADAIISIIY